MGGFERGNLVEVEVEGVYIDRLLDTPILFLKERAGDRILPVWIGASEAMAILIAMHNQILERPMTHDLMKIIIKTFDADIQNVVVQEVKNGTFYARIHVTRDNTIYEIDARPSDSIAIALRFNARIYVQEDVMETGSSFVLEDGLKKNLEKLTPETFGKFKL
ncbi:bifunctional nuclease family protein [candidate division WOR-3 bacterium]|nr:bifunctional nuclease family protein [candidate division WOR-3 bacterium]